MFTWLSGADKVEEGSVERGGEVGDADVAIFSEQRSEESIPAAFNTGFKHPASITGVVCWTHTAPPFLSGWPHKVQTAITNISLRNSKT